jgi:hypothetical protein
MSTQTTFTPTHPTNEPFLSNEQVVLAKEELLKDTNNFPRINRRFVDPPKAGEPKFALFSYIDHPDVDMDKFLEDIKDSLKFKHRKRLDELQARSSRVKGIAKIRGAYMSQQEADQRAEEIVREVDSTNSIFMCVIGMPFPLVSEGFAEEIREIDIRKETENAISQNVRKQRMKEKKEMEEIKMREEDLMRNAEKDPNVDDADNYTAQRVKLSHLRYSIEQHVKKHAECVDNEKRCVSWLLDMKTRHPEFEEMYMEKYMAGRKAAYIPDDHIPEGFMRYMNDPLVKLDTEDTTLVKLDTEDTTLVKLDTEDVKL